MFEITADPIDAAGLLEAVRDPRFGAEILFLGVCRDHNLGRKVDHLVYEAYEPMARRALEQIGETLRERYTEVRVAIVHRTGKLAIGEASVGIAVASAHRDLAYRASRDAIELLKREVPIWKKEHFEGGAVWVEGPGAPPRPVNDAAEPATPSAPSSGG